MQDTLSIVGEWKGTIKLSLFPMRLNANVTFTSDGNYRIRVKGAFSKGEYSTKNDIIHLTPRTPKRVKPATMSYLLEDDELRIWGSTAGIKGDLRVKKLQEGQS